MLQWNGLVLGCQDKICDGALLSNGETLSSGLWFSRFSIFNQFLTLTLWPKVSGRRPNMIGNIAAGQKSNMNPNVKGVQGTSGKGEAGRV